jgi:ATP-dependent Zn protease
VFDGNSKRWRMRLGDLKTVTNPDPLLRTARHEAGHCLIGWLRGQKTVQISIVARGDVGGSVEREADEERMMYTIEDLEGMIRQSLRGRAAEMVYYSEKGGLTTGASADLKSATHSAELMVREYGMGDGIGHVVIDPKRLGDGPLAIEVMQATERIIKQQIDSAVQLIKENRPTIDRLVYALMEKNGLTHEDLESIMSEIGQVRVPTE